MSPLCFYLFTRKTEMTADIEKETPEQILARLDAEADEIDVEKDLALFDIAREAAEEGDPSDEASDLPNVLPTAFATLRGLGAEGPHKIYIPCWLPVPGEDDPDKAWKMQIIKKKIGPYRLKDQIEASEAIAAIHEDSFKLCLAWSYQKGEGDLDIKAVVELLEKAYPKQILNPITGEQMEREAFNEEGVTLLVNSVLKDLTYDNIEAMLDAVHIALKRFEPDLEREWLEEHCDVGLLIRIIGKILYINSGLRDRFLA